MAEITYTPASPGGIQQLLLADLVAASATFRGVVGTADHDAALAHVYFNYTDDATARRPRAIVLVSDFEEADDGNHALRVAEQLDLSFEFDVPKQYEGNVRDEALWFNDKVFGIVHDMLQLSGTGQSPSLTTSTYCDVKRIRLDVPPAENDPDEWNGERFYGVTFSVPVLG